MADIEAHFHLNRPGFALAVDLTLPNRGVTALFGPSGSGKTTVLRCIAGLERAPQGRLSVNGAIWQDTKNWLPTHRRPIGYVFQEASLFPHLTVLGNLHYGMKRNPEAQQASLDHAIALLGIAPLLHRKPGTLSGGERQRVAIARALAVKPRILLLDEPLAALDCARKQEILPYLEQLHDALAIPVLYVSHAPDEVARLADHLVVLEAGRMWASGPLAEVLARLDGPLGLGAATGVVLAGRIGEVDPIWHLARVDFPGGALWVPDPGLPTGRPTRVWVLARDVSLAEAPGASSIQNVLYGVVDAMGADEHPSLALVRVRVGASVLLARLTQRALAVLGVVTGKPLWVQIKSAALLA